MPRLKPDTYKPWTYRGRVIGYRRSGIYHIDRSILGQRVRASTGCADRTAAEEEYRRFEANPAAYVSRLGRRALPRVPDSARAEQLRVNHLARAYRLTPAGYDALLARQEGRCAVCGGIPSGGKRGRLDVDHDHATGVVRGLLCGPCNRGIGALGDSAALLRRAAEYLDARAMGSEWSPHPVETRENDPLPEHQIPRTPIVSVQSS